MTDTKTATAETRREEKFSINTEMASTIALSARESVVASDGISIRSAFPDEGALLWELAKEAGGIDLNSPYAYMMQCRNFHETSVIAESFGEPAGFVTAHRIQKRPDTLFVWQVAVLPEHRGLGVGQRMLEHLVERYACVGVRKIETTVTPSNKASEKMFKTFAESRGATLEIGNGFALDDFPEDEQQESERLFTLQPIHPVE